MILDTKLPMQPRKAGLTWRLLFVALSTSFGSWFGFGYTVTQTNSPQDLIIQWINSTICLRSAGNQSNVRCQLDMESKSLKDDPTMDIIWGLVGATVYVGAFCAACFSNYLVAKFGAKQTLLWMNSLAVLGTVLTGISQYVASYEVLIIGRFFLGAYGGFSIAIVPAYITEISPPYLRGALGAIPGLNLTLGCLVSVTLGLPECLGTADLWPYIFWIRMLPALTLFATLPFCPESPRYLFLTRKRKADAEIQLAWLRGTLNVEEELETIKLEGETETAHKPVQILGLFKDSFSRKTTFIVIVILFIQQFSGISGIFIYSTSIFEGAGLDKSQAMYGSVGLMVVQVISVLLTVLLSDWVGRRFLLLVGHFGSILCAAGMVLFMSLQKSDVCEDCPYGTLVAAIAFMLLHNIGPGFISWLLVSEMFGQASRAVAMTVGVLVCNASALCISFIFPLLNSYLDQWTFAIFAGIEFFGTVFLCFRLVETKGKEINDIQAELRRKLM